MKKELFIEALNKLAAVDKYNNDLNTMLKKNGSEGYIIQPNCSDIVIRILREEMKDTSLNSPIEFFIFESNYGKKKATYSDKDGNVIDLSSPELLYNYLKGKD